MAQHDYNIANQGFPAFRSDLNNALSAIQTTNSGTSRPTGAVAGQLWLDTTTATSPTLKYYDGADDISLATIDHTANTVNWLDSTVSITGLTTTATGTVLTLSDSANTTTVNLILDNQKEIRFRETTANGTNYVALKAPASVSADLTFTLPATDGTNGQVLTTNGSGVLTFITPSAGIAWQSSVKTSGFTAVAGEGYFCNTTSAEFTVTLPATPTAGQQVAVVDYAGTFATNNLIITSTAKINGSDNDVKLTTNREGTILVYIDSTQGWLAYSGVNEGTSPSLTDNPPTYSIDFLVIAGGGSGGSLSNAGGGGAGGYRTSTQTIGIGTVITVTVGDGGASTNNAGSNSGSNSSISGSGLTTITSTGGGGGGGGGGAETNGKNGGSGGGAGNGGTGGSGNTPSTSPSQGNNGGNGNGNPPAFGAGGGGGAGAVGGLGTSTDPGEGGNGLASSITGTSVTRAGGGGGGTDSGGAGGGGTGGGGPASNSTPGTAGTANTGSGGGGAETGQNSGAGGKGVVILSLPTANYSSTTTGSPTVTTSGSNTILQFNGSGSYTT